MGLIIGSPALRRNPLGVAWVAVLLAGALIATPVHADLQVNLRRDKVELTDGTVVECIVLMQTPRGVLIAVKDPNKEDGVIQKIIPANKVKNVVRGEDEGQMKGLKTEEELARKVIQGSGYRKDGTEEAPQPINPTGPIEAVQPVAPSKTASNDPQPIANSKLSPQDVAHEYLSRFPDMREASLVFLGGSDRVGELFQRAQKDDANLREQLDGFLNLFLKSVQPPEKTIGKRPVGNKPKPPAGKPPAPKPAPPATKQDKSEKQEERAQ